MDKGLAKPQISVVLSVYNGANYVRLAIDSILAQTFKDFELIVIDDGSTDGTDKVLKSYTDPRLRVVAQENKGLVASLNTGVQLAEADYVARQDADDISDPSRLKEQLDYLKKNPDCVIVGSSIKVMDDKDSVLHEHRVLLNDPELRQELLVRSPFAHGSVVFKKSAAVSAGGYTASSWPAEDYDMWLRMSEFGTFANIDKPLYIYREHDAGISISNQAEQMNKADEIRAHAWQQKTRLTKGRIRLSSYSHLKMGRVRQERIIDNIISTYRKAWRERDLAYCAKLKTLVWSDKITYRILASRAKRKFRSMP